uniref:Amine oxidase domain-containing protein n=1 Tax=Vitrella brassicaformis TaxID=1169539 RepID=A0A7S1P995_9ALVE
MHQIGRRHRVSMVAPSKVPQETDVVVIGSGIGGLCCAALLAKYGDDVTVCESHVYPGGAAHSFERDGYMFDSGPSLWAGMSQPSINPLRQVLDAVGEEDSIEWCSYDGWSLYTPEGTWRFTVGPGNFEPTLRKYGGEQAVKEWRALLKKMEPIIKVASGIPPMALRADPFAVLTVLPYLPSLLGAGRYANKLTGPFTNIMKGTVSNPFLYNFLDYLAFALSGLPANETIGAAVAVTLSDMTRPGRALDYPKGGGGAVVDALVRGIEKHDGRVLLGAHVDEVLVEGGRAVGVRLKNGKTIKARKAVVTNASVWDTAKLLNPDVVPPELFSRADRTPTTDSFMHLHLGIRADGLPKDFDIHHSVVFDWDVGIAAPANMVIVSIPTVLDPSLAPEGHHVVHAYTAGNEPYELWADLKPTSPEYRQLKEERGDILWRAVERFIPDIKRRAKVAMVGTPKTHERYLRRDRGTYGPVLRAGEQTLPGAGTPIPRLLCCGDSVFPGIGVPAVAASGCIAAHSLVGVGQHYQMLQRVLKRGERTAEMDVTEYEPAAAAKATTPVGAK